MRYQETGMPVPCFPELRFYRSGIFIPCSRNTVAKVLKRAQELDISWPLEDNQTDEVLEGLFYPKQRDRSQKRILSED